MPVEENVVITAQDKNMAAMTGRITAFGTAGRSNLVSVKIVSAQNVTLERPYDDMDEDDETEGMRLLSSRALQAVWDDEPSDL